MQQYFPNRNLQASADLLGDVDRFHHFGVAYENLLRDGVQRGSVQLPLVMPVCLPAPVAAGAVWTFRTTRGGDECEPLRRGAGGPPPYQRFPVA